MHQLIEFLCEPILSYVTQLNSMLCDMFRVCFFFSFYTYSWYDNWNEPKIEAGNLFFNLIVYFLFHLNRSLSKKKRIYFVGVKCLPIRKNVCSLFVQRFSICSFVHFFRQCYWHYSWIIYWTEGSLFICTPHIQSGPISNFTLSFLVFLLSSQREKAKQSEKKKRQCNPNCLSFFFIISDTLFSQRNLHFTNYSFIHSNWIKTYHFEIESTIFIFYSLSFYLSF